MDVGGPVRRRTLPMDLTVKPDSADWLESAMQLLEGTGFVIVPSVLDVDSLTQAREAHLRVEVAMHEQLGPRLEQSRQRGDWELRAPMRFEPHFYKFLEEPRLLALLDAYLSPTATLRFQQLTVIKAGPSTFRPGPWHMNFRRVLNGYRAALEVGFAVDTIEEGAYWFALGSHQRTAEPDKQTLEALGRTVVIPAGSMFAFDSTLWHREGACDPSQDRLLVLHQFVRHFVKPHLDYVRILGGEVVQALPRRTQRLLGWESRVPASLDEFYVDPSDRLYLPDQG